MTLSVVAATATANRGTNLSIGQSLKKILQPLLAHSMQDDWMRIQLHRIDHYSQIDLQQMHHENRVIECFGYVSAFEMFLFYIEFFNYTIETLMPCVFIRLGLRDGLTQSYRLILYVFASFSFRKCVTVLIISATSSNVLCCTIC